MKGEAFGWTGRILARLAWGSAGAVGLLLVFTFIRTNNAGIPLRLAIGALAGLAAIAPQKALLVLAGLLPFSSALTGLAGASLSGTALAEGMVIATTGPWMLRRALGDRNLPGSLGHVKWSAAVVALIALMSCTMQLTLVGLQLGGGRALARELALFFSTDYFERSRLFTVVTITGSLVEGLAVLLMTAALCVEAPAFRVRLPLMMVAGAAGAAALNVIRIVTSAVGTEAPARALRQLWMVARVSMHYDRNAAGSVFAMMALVCAGLVGGSWRRRAMLQLALLLLLAGLWLTGSRSALAAAALGALAFVAAVVWHAETPRRRLRAAVWGAVVIAVGITIAALYPASRNPSVEGSVTGRKELAIAALRMVADHPVFGIGIGRFYERSADYGRPQLPSVLPPGSTRENSHNNFLQVLAELGVAGFAAFIWLLGASLLPAVRAIRAQRDLTAATGVAAGAFAYVLTWLTGHPLLVPEALYPFFIVLGIAAAMETGVGASSARRSRARVIAGVAAALLTAISPFRIAGAMRNADLEHVGYGVSGWQADPQVGRFRLAAADAAVFVPGDAGAIFLPLRRPSSEGPLEVTLLLDGRPADRVTLIGAEWQYVRMVIPPGRGKYRRLDVHARTRSSGTAARLMIGRVRAIHGEVNDVPVPAGPVGASGTAGDYDGDGKTDPTSYSPPTGTWVIGDKMVVRFGKPDDRPVPADYDGDGLTDVAVFQPSSGTWLVRNHQAVQFGDPDDIPVPADYNRDRRIDEAVYRPSTGMWYVRNQGAVPFGDAGDVPVPADYDGDGVIDFAVFRPSTGTWYVRNHMAVQFGDPQDLPIPGDYDGNGVVDLAVYRPSTGFWYVRDQFAVQFGNTGDIPMPGDYDGDGALDLAVYRPSTGDWFVRNQGLTGLARDLWRLLKRRSR